MQTEELLNVILDLGRAMVVNGAEVWRVEEILNGICDAYSFREHDILVMTRSLQATVQTGDGQIITQIKRVKRTGFDDRKLERLFAVARRIPENPVDPEVLKKQVHEITESPGKPLWVNLVGCVIVTVGFMLFFNGDIYDIPVTAITAVVVQLILRNVMNVLNNLMTANTFSAFVIGGIVLPAARLGAVHNPGSVITAEILLLLSGLGLMNGFRNLLHNDVLSGITDTTDALLGAVGIVVGIMLAMFVILDYTNIQVRLQDLVASPVLQVLYCTMCCTGSAMMFGARREAIFFSAAGAAMTRCVYLLVSGLPGAGAFRSTLAGAVFVALYSCVIEMLTHIPETVFITTCILPLLPGLSLYYAVLSAVTSDYELFLNQSRNLILIYFSICIGFVIVDIPRRYLHLFRLKCSRSPRK